VLGVLAGLALVLVGQPVGWLAPGAYVAANLTASGYVGRRLTLRDALRLPLVFASMHLSWGWGFLTSSRNLGRD
jgi:succinoglycan biosynthesis protein ExoA